MPSEVQLVAQIRLAAVHTRAASNIMRRIAAHGPGEVLAAGTVEEAAAELSKKLKEIADILYESIEAAPARAGQA